MQPKEPGPRFFCEHCGTEVPRDLQSCPRCGRFFSNVRCPACGFTGNEQLFDKGCPVCSYSNTNTQLSKSFKKEDTKVRAGKLPIWVYMLTLAALASVLYFLILSLR